MTDEKAMLAVSEGEINKTAILYERYKKPLFNFFLKYGIGREQSQDLVQQVFVRVIQYKHSFKADNDFKPWIFRISRNVFNDYYKSNKMVLTEIFQDVPETIDDDEPSKLIQKALEKLPLEFKEVLIMSRYEDLKYEQIADVLGISVALVKVRVHRALKKLKEIYLEINEQ